MEDGKLTREDIENAPMFKVFTNYKGRCIVHPLAHPDWVVESHVGDPDDLVYKMLKLRGISVRHGFDIERDDDLVYGAGLIDQFDDIDAAVVYLNNGGSFVKLPWPSISDASYRLVPVTNLEPLR